MQVLILSFESIQLIQSFLIRVLHFEELGAEGTQLFLGPLQVSLAFLILLLPL